MAIRCTPASAGYVVRQVGKQTMQVDETAEERRRRLIDQRVHYAVRTSSRKLNTAYFALFVDGKLPEAAIPEARRLIRASQKEMLRKLRQLEAEKNGGRGRLPYVAG